jgi:hypothetical protein
VEISCEFSRFGSMQNASLEPVNRLRMARQ